MGNKNCVGRKIRELRMQRHMSQYDLSVHMQLEGCDLDKNAITRIENGNRRVYDYELSIFKLVFKVEYEVFFSDT